MVVAYPSNRLCIYRGTLCITYSVLITIRIYILFHNFPRFYAKTENIVIAFDHLRNVFKSNSFSVGA